MRRPGRSPTVVKVFDPARGSAFGRAGVDLEVDALRAVSGVATAGVRFVQPLQAWPEWGTYEMEHVVGRSLLEAMVVEELDARAVARRLQQGLHAFARHAVVPFGDLHYDNVLVQEDGTFVLLDPVATPTVRWVAGGGVARTLDATSAHAEDLVTLVVVEALRLPRRLRTSYAAGAAAARLTRAFATLAAQSESVGGPDRYRRACRHRLQAHAGSQGWRGQCKLAYRRPILEAMLATT